MAVRRFRQAPELKFHDVTVDDAVIAMGANMLATSLCLILSGVSESQRIGRKCTITKIGWKLRVTIPTVNGGVLAPTGDTIRLMLVLDKQCNKLATTATAILETSDYQSFNNLSNKGRFTTLMDRTYTLNYVAGIGTSGDQDWAAQLMDDTFYKDVNIPIEYNASAGTLADINSNNLVIVACSASGVGGITSQIRLRFQDA